MEIENLNLKNTENPISLFFNGGIRANYQDVVYAKKDNEILWINMDRINNLPYGPLTKAQSEMLKKLGVQR